MSDKRIGPGAKAAARSLLKKGGMRVLGAPRKASPAPGLRRLSPFPGEDALDALLRGAARQENEALNFPEAWEFLKQAKARKSANRARWTRSLSAAAACLVIAAAGVIFLRGQPPAAPRENAAPQSIGAPLPEDMVTAAGESAGVPFCALQPPAAADQNDFEIAGQDDAGMRNESPADINGSLGGSGSAAADTAQPLEIRLIGEAQTLSAKRLGEQGVTVEFGVVSPISLEVGEAAVYAKEDGVLALDYHYSFDDTLRLHKAGADTETLFTLAVELAQ